MRRFKLILFSVCPIMVIAGLFFLFRPARPNIIVILLDALRADHLGVYGYERDTSPVLDRFAKENTLFRHAISASNWTPVSVASILTGRYPSGHGMIPPDGRELAKKQSTRLSSELDTLPEILKRRRYRTAAVVTNPWVKDAFGYAQGFEQFVIRTRERADWVTKNALKIIDGWGGSKKPFFMYLHYLDPHDPYDPPGRFASMFSGKLSRDGYGEAELEKIGRYDGEIRYLDTSLGQLFNGLKERGLYNAARIIIVADHGEQFKERGDQGHGFRLYNEETHIPLMIKDNQTRREVDYSVSNIDVFATVLSMAGARPPPGLQAFSLLDDKVAEQRAGVLSEARRKYDIQAYVNHNGEKLIIEGGDKPVTAAFDSRGDYFERVPLNNQSLVEDLRGALDQMREIAAKGRTAKSSETQISDETLEQLKSLGYLQ